MPGSHGGSTVSTRSQRYRRRISRTLIGLVGLLPLLLAACGQQGASGDVQAADQTFVYPYTRTDNIKDAVYDPAIVAYAADSTITSMLYSGLVTLGPDLKVQADLAEKWDVDSTGTIYTFRLRPNLRFSDGTPLTASDFAYSIDRALAPDLCTTRDGEVYGDPTVYKSGNGFCGLIDPTAYLGFIIGAQERFGGTVNTIISDGNDPKKGLNVLDPQTLRIRLTKPVAFFLQALTYPISYPVERKLVEKYPGGRWVQHLDEGGSSGPFKMAKYDASTTPQQITMVPNPYWADAFGQKLTLQRVIRPFYASVDDEYKDYRSGKNDYTDVPVKDYFTALGQGDFKRVPILQTDYFGLNTKQAPFNSLLVRQAFALALNKQYLVDKVENGGAIPTNHIVPKGMPGYNPNLVTPGPNPTRSLTGNQDVAKQLLKQAQQACASATPDINGLLPPECPYITGSNPLPVEIRVSGTNQTRVSIAEQAAEQWNATLGLNVKAKPTPPDELGPNLRPQGPYQMWIIGWIADYPDPQDWLSLQFMSTSGFNTSSLNKPDLDALFKKADVEQDPKARLEMYSKAEQAVVNEAVWIPYQQAQAFWRMRSWVHGFGLNSGAFMPSHNWPQVFIVSH